jgi:hypothetical protein
MNASLKGLVPILRHQLQSGKAIAVVGWRDSDHDSLTRNLYANQVAFGRHKRPDGTFGYLLVTTHITSAERGKATKGIRSHPTLLNPDDVKNALQQCKDLLRVAKEPEIPFEPPEAPSPSNPPDAEEPVTEDTSTEEPGREKLLDLLTHPGTTRMNSMDKFVTAFQKEAAASSDGTVGSRTLGKLVLEHKVPNAQILLKGGFLIPITGEGKLKIGRYKAGHKMVELARQSTSLPDDPLDAMRLLVSQKPEVEQSIKDHEAQLFALREKLGAIEEAEKHFGQLTALSLKLRR